MGDLAEALAKVDAVYEIPDDDLIGDVLVPAMASADEARIGSGYFSSQCLAQIAPGLASFIERTDTAIRLLISPEISAEDRAAIEEGTKTPQEVIDRIASEILGESRQLDSALATHTRECFAYLVAAQRLDIRFVLMEAGMFHKKQWLVRTGDEWVAVHGSSNATSRGLLVNGEQMTVDREWCDGPAAERRVGRLVEQWDRQWHNEHPHSLTLAASEGLKVAGPRTDSGRVPTVSDFWEAWRRDHAAGLEPPLPQSTPLRNQRLTVPPFLEWRNGRYQHQGAAVDALLRAHGQGVLAIATGGGKTRTALIAATEAQDRHAGPTLVIVLVPSKPLMRQWAEDVGEFGIEPVLPSTVPPTIRKGLLLEVEVGLATKDVRSEVMIVTNSLFARDEGIRALVAGLPPDVQLILIGDEMHNLGAAGVFGTLPERADVRIGLSATPVRQYDQDGTDRLFDYFGQQAFEFGLDDAIRSGCLTPYRYYVHEVPMSDREVDKWTELTEQLARAGFEADDTGQEVVPTKRGERLLRQRRAVLEQAEAKVGVLEGLLYEMGPSSVQRCLVYCSAKPLVVEETRQIEQANEMLSRLGVISHQFTSEETTNRTASKLLEAFGRGDYQVLTAMKVLDEGIDIPQTDTAFLLASSAVRREWVQRRGRILRKAPDKSLAHLHDFLVVPSNPESREGASILKAELRRAVEFARLAENEWDADGPRRVISKFESLTWTRS